MQWPFRITIFLPSALLHDIFENTLTEGTHVCGVLIRVHLEKRKETNNWKVIIRVGNDQ